MLKGDCRRTGVLKPRRGGEKKARGVAVSGLIHDVPGKHDAVSRADDSRRSACFFQGLQQGFIIKEFNFHQCIFGVLHPVTGGYAGRAVHDCYAGG